VIACQLLINAVTGKVGPGAQVTGYPGGFNGSMQHHLEVYLADFRGQNPLPVIDSKKTPS